MSNSIYRIVLTKINNSLIDIIDNYGKKENECNLDYGEYKAYGQFDSVSITQCETLSIDDILLNYYDAMKQQSTGDSQIFYGILNNKIFLNKASVFFDNSQWVYQYIVFLDLQNLSTSALITKLSEDENYKNDHTFLVLETLDKHSAILLIRKRSIRECLDFIYTIASCCPEFVWNINYRLLTMKNAKTYKSIMSQSDSESISITINFKIKNLDVFKLFIKELCDKLNNAEIKKCNFVSNSDYTINLYDYPSYKFFSLFYSGCLLDRTNKNLYNAVRYTHTFVSIDLDEMNITKSDDSTKSLYPTDFQKKVDEYLHKLYTFEKNYAKSSNDFSIKESSAIVMKFIQVMWDLNKYDKNSIYLINVILPALYEYVAQIQLNSKTNMADMYRCIEDMHNSLNSLLSTNYRAGHDYMTIPVLYYTPTKIISFYSQYLRKLSSIVKQSCNDRTRYEFLLSPRLHTVANVVSYTPDNFHYMHRFLSIHMPIKSLFDFKNSLIALTHEAGHFLPNNKLRCRESRMSYLLKSIMTAIGIELTNGMINKNLGSETREYIKKIINEVNQSVLLQILACQEDKTKYYLIYSEELIRDVIIEYFKSNQNIITANFPYKELISQLRNNIVTLLQNNNESSINIMYLNLERVLRECYSDLFVIKILKLTFEDYYLAIKSTSSKGVKLQLNAFLTIRIALMCKVNHWDISHYNDERLESVKNIIELLNNSKESEKIELLSGIQNRAIFKNVEKYLKECSIELEQTLIKNEDIQIIQECFVEIDRAIRSNDILLLIKIFDKFDLQQDVFGTLESVIEEINDKISIDQ